MNCSNIFYHCNCWCICPVLWCIHISPRWLLFVILWWLMLKLGLIRHRMMVDLWCIGFQDSIRLVIIWTAPLHKISCTTCRVLVAAGGLGGAQWGLCLGIEHLESFQVAPGYYGIIMGLLWDYYGIIMGLSGTFPFPAVSSPTSALRGSALGNPRKWECPNTQTIGAVHVTASPAGAGRSILTKIWQLSKEV